MSSKRITVAPERQLKEIKVGAEEIIAEEELMKKLEQSWESQRPLRVKLGADPSRPDIHLGHTVVLNKLRRLQEFGHQVTFIIGDFTGKIGDPTGKSKTRPELKDEEIADNSKTYRDQVFKILDPERTEIVYNSHWLGKLSPVDLIRLMAKRTVQQLIVRDDFAKRFKDRQPIHLHEFVYPILQGYDSVHLRADIELGGTDQKFNLLMGREMQRQAGQAAQVVLLMPLLEGIDGVQKMSKSLDNYIGIDESARNIFGKTMSVSDEHMLRFYELLSDKGSGAIAALKDSLAKKSLHPMQAKKELAFELTARYWGNEAARAEQEYFEKAFSRRLVPDELPEYTVTCPSSGDVNWVDVALEIGFAKTRSEVRRVIKQKGFKVDGSVISQERQTLKVGAEHIVKMGKLRLAKIKVAAK